MLERKVHHLESLTRNTPIEPLGKCKTSGLPGTIVTGTTKSLDNLVIEVNSSIQTPEIGQPSDTPANRLGHSSNTRPEKGLGQEDGNKDGADATWAPRQEVTEEDRAITGQSAQEYLADIQ